MPVVERIGVGQPVIFIHGSPGDRHTWKRVVRHRPAGYSAWLMELPGHGEQPIGEGGLDAYVKDVAAAIEESPVPVVLAGLSLGGYMVLRMMASHADRIERVVACAAPATFTQDGIDFRVTLAADVRAGRYTDESFFAAIVDGMMPPVERDEESFELMRASVVGQSTERIARLIDRVTEIGDPAARIGPFSTPVDLLIGQNDAFLPLAEAESVRALGTRATLTVVPSSSHMLPLSHSELVARHVFSANA